MKPPRRRPRALRRTLARLPQRPTLAIGEVTPEQQAAAESAIKADPDVTVPDDKPVYIYAQTYLNITPTAYDAAAGQQVLTLDIEPMYRVVASVEETAETLQVKGDDGVTDANAVVLENSETPLDITTLEISVPLPGGVPDGKPGGQT